jgi:hypothetical protein
MEPSTITDTTNRTFGTLRKNVFVVVCALTLITYSLVSHSYSGMLGLSLESQSVRKKTPSTTVSVAANSTVLVFNKTKSRSAHSQSSAPRKDPATPLSTKRNRVPSSSRSRSKNTTAVTDAAVDYFNGINYCPLKSLPNTTKPFEWAYFQKVAKTNEKLAAAARPFSISSPAPLASSQHRIPRRLIFTHRYNLFDCKSSRVHLTPTLHMLAANARQTVALYRQFWGEPAAEVTFLTDVDCLRVLNMTEPRLLKYFKKEKGMYKADICRVAELYLNGGYYFDVDLLAVHPVSPADSISFATVRGTGWPKHGFFQAFTASAPGHPILKKSLDTLLEVYTGKRKRKGWIGPETMQIAYEMYRNKTSPEEVSRDLLLLDEVAIKNAKKVKYCPDYISALPKQTPNPAAFRSGVCDHVVYDHSTQYFYSRVNGTAWCGARPGGFPQDKLPAILHQTVPPNNSLTPA